MFDDCNIDISGLRLRSFEYRSGGDMRGGFYRMSVEATGDGKAVIRIEEASCHNQEPSVSERTVDGAILGELEEVIRKYRMETWHRKKFTDMFIADGRSYSYCFDFGREYITFFSQIFPNEYREKLEEFDLVFGKYQEQV